MKSGRRPTGGAVGPSPPSVAVPVGSNATRIHEQIRKEIAQQRQLQVAQDAALWKLHGRPRHANDGNYAKEQVGYGCQAVDRLLDQLVQQTKEEDTLLDAALFVSNAEPKDRADMELIDEVQTLRTLASDDTSLETNSVADYSADPPAAPSFSSTSIVEVRDELFASYQKMVDSLETILSILNGSPHWWTSPIVMRRLKTHGIRIDYHGRKIRKWSNQCRAHLFVSSSMLNRAAQEGTVELSDLRAQQVTFAKRKERLVKRRQELQAIADDLSMASEEVAVLHTKLLGSTLTRGQALAATLVDKPHVDFESAEALLLLAVVAKQFPELDDQLAPLVAFYGRQRL